MEEEKTEGERERLEKERIVVRNRGDSMKNERKKKRKELIKERKRETERKG